MATTVDATVPARDATAPADDAAAPDASSAAKVIASGQQVPMALATDGTNVYWRNLGETRSAGPKTPLPSIGGSIMACPLEGCSGAPRTIIGGLVTSSFGEFALAADGTFVYSTESAPDGGDAVFSCPVGGCSGTPRIYAEGLFGDVAASGGAVYWLDRGQPRPCTVFACSAAPDPPMPWCVAPADDVHVQDNFVVADGFAYWMDLGGAIRQCSLPDCAGGPNVIVDGVLGASGLAVAGGYVFVANGDPLAMGSLYECATTGCPKRLPTLASRLSNVMAIAADAKNVYWTEQGDGPSDAIGTGSVRRCAVTGCGGAPETLASNLTRPSAIALSADRVYWIEAGLDERMGRIWMAPK
jgi:hypothetical protein